MQKITSFTRGFIYSYKINISDVEYTSIKTRSKNYYQLGLCSGYIYTKHKLEILTLVNLFIVSMLLFIW
jgi:hypothetical protein